MKCLINSKDEVAKLAMKYLGYPSLKVKHQKHGKDPTGFDCSGFVKFLLEHLNFPGLRGIRCANDFFDRFGVLIHTEAAGKGDLVFFSRNGIVPQHIGIMLSPQYYISSQGTTKGRVRISLLQHKPIISSLSEQIYFHNPIGFKRLSVKEGRYQRVLS